MGERQLFRTVVTRPFTRYYYFKMPAKRATIKPGENYSNAITRASMYYDLYHVISIIVGVSHARMIFFGGKGGNVVSFFFLKRLRSVVMYVCTYMYVYVYVYGEGGPARARSRCSRVFYTHIVI